jgi:prepilin-type processing-associated H-X9-DG protein
MAGGRLTWTGKQHHFKGNVLFADGHVEEWSDGGTGTLVGSGNFVLPSVGSDGGQPGQSVAANPAADSNSSVPPENAAPAESGAATNQTTTNPPAAPRRPPETIPAAAAGRAGTTTMASGPIQSAFSNSVSERAAATTDSSGGAAVSTPSDDDSTMAPFDRRIADFLRHLIFGTYLLILLLILLFIAYRIWQWTQDTGRKRRQ